MSWYVLQCQLDTVIFVFMETAASRDMSIYLVATIKAATNSDFNLGRNTTIQSLCGRHEKRLLNHLLANYNTLERPVANESEPLEVKFGITLQQIIDVIKSMPMVKPMFLPVCSIGKKSETDEKNQILTTNAWLKLLKIILLFITIPHWSKRHVQNAFVISTLFRRNVDLIMSILRAKDVRKVGKNPESIYHNSKQLTYLFFYSKQLTRISTDTNSKPNALQLSNTGCLQILLTFRKQLSLIAVRIQNFVELQQCFPLTPPCRTTQPATSQFQLRQPMTWHTHVVLNVSNYPMSISDESSYLDSRTNPILGIAVLVSAVSRGVCGSLDRVAVSEDRLGGGLINSCKFIRGQREASGILRLALPWIPENEWTDYNLQWNETEYGGVKDLRITPNKLWKPDILMYNRKAARRLRNSAAIAPLQQKLQSYIQQPPDRCM
ncbi:Neuronal acetylcholine receptor subunit alpha-7 [Camponotus floridanus]|uniref:Neuronal acetylcholine receptor subunit alpha-7 n=1 Tax=Camponotus floridanus TaxID=104421 RepID=E2A8J1_CAMFO|nr:Neuronal acetylcholine receptor subunit alpha-7 [Camponotus floridanus]